ncbi:MAG: PQQ-dependent sugar dehydrogenase [Saprospiraceae bacterium]|nr:PQQ-dependent sugar dehydrogenase [Saprospiraceae bacterium]MCB0676360.1 PQQ-dependent sugar dehydrogenase [Saprospiraceae bacterium]
MTKTNLPSWKALFLLVLGVYFYMPLYAQEQPGLSEIRLDTIVRAGGLQVPWDLEWIGDERILFTEIGGRIALLDLRSGAVKEVYRVDDLAREGQAGLMGMALHPDFSKQPLVFIAYTYFGNSEDEVFVRLEALRFDEKAGKLRKAYLVADELPGEIINIGGRVFTSPDGKVFLTVGERAIGELAQDVGTVNGKILRYNLDGSIPEDNPFPGSPVWALGFRNPQGLAWVDGKIFGTEHGTFTNDELNLLSAGGNYGWPEIAGFCDSTEMAACAEKGYRDPLLTWTPTVAPCGLAYYPHDRFPAWQNALLMATLKDNRLYALRLDETKSRVVASQGYLHKVAGRIRDVLVAPDGRVFICNSNDDYLGEKRPTGDQIIELVAGAGVAEAVEDTTAHRNNELVQTLQLDSTELEVRIIAQDQRLPWEMAWPGDGWLWFSERGGAIKKMQMETGEIKQIYQVEGVYESKDNSGMHGMALHPDFPAEPYIYVHYTLSLSESQLVRLTYDAQADTVVSSEVLLGNLVAKHTHNGSRIAFGPDKTMYFTLGDANRKRLPQQLDSYNGKILRMNPDGSVPADNPIPGSLIWSYGHRNPQGLVIASNGKIYSSEHGPTTDDEVNLIQKGRNYGWPKVEGFCDTRSESKFCEDYNVVEPLYAWSPTVGVCGMDYYDHDAIPEWKNSLLLGNLKGGNGDIGQRLCNLRLDAAGERVIDYREYFTYTFGRIRDVLVLPDGRVLLCTSNRETNSNAMEVVGPLDDLIIEIKAVR